MTAATLSRLPLSAGGALAASLVRGGLWTVAALIDAASWAAARFMKAPVAISCIIAVGGFSLLAGSNALFLQSGHHPAPLFFSPSKPQIASIKPVSKRAAVAQRAHMAAVGVDEETTGSVGQHKVAAHAIGNEDVAALQKKLTALKLFDGTVDGLYGRRTAAAIKAFEIRSGQKPRGRLTPEVLEAVLAAPLPKPEASAPVEPMPVAAAFAGPVQKTPPAQAQPIAPAAAVASARPVPLAPIRRTVQTIPIAGTPEPENANPSVAPAAAAAASPAATPVLASVTPSAPAPTAQSVAAQAAELAKPAVAQPPAQAVPGPAAVTAAAAPNATPAGVPAAGTPDGAVMAMNNLPVPASSASPSEPSAIPSDGAQTPAQRLAAQMGTLPPEATAATAVPSATPAGPAGRADASSDPGEGAGSTDPVLITKIQRGLASLGFLGAKIDGVPGEGTAKAIRNFEVFYDYKVTGLATPQLLNLLIQHGAVI